MRAFLLSVSLALLGSSGLHGQTTPAPRSFVVASIHLNPVPWHVLVGYSSSGTRLTLEAYDPVSLIMEAYRVEQYQVSLALPRTEYYNLAAKAPDGVVPTRAEFRQMLQTLLADRFHLKFHREIRAMPVYALVLGKSGPKFKESAPDAKVVGRHGVNGRNQTVSASRYPMALLVTDLTSFLGVERPVLDKTGLTGAYDVHLEATPQWRIDNDPQLDDISIFDALQGQLGLRIEPQKADIEVLVVDHIGKPSDN